MHNLQKNCLFLQTTETQLDIKHTLFAVLEYSADAVDSHRKFRERKASCVPCWGSMLQETAVLELHTWVEVKIMVEN